MALHWILLGSSVAVRVQNSTSILVFKHGGGVNFWSNLSIKRSIGCRWKGGWLLLPWINLHVRTAVDLCVGKRSDSFIVAFQGQKHTEACIYLLFWSQIAHQAALKSVALNFWNKTTAVPVNLYVRLLRARGWVIDFSLLLILSTCSIRERLFIFGGRLWVITVMLMLIESKVVEERAAATRIVDWLGRMLSVMAPVEDHIELVWH